MSLALVSRKAALLPPWLRNELWARARAVPSLDLRFADNKSLVDATTGANLVTFTRASSGTYVGSDGLIKTATTDEPRFDHNPTTGESLGLLVEEARTNSCTNNTMQGAASGTPGTAPTAWAVSTSSSGLTREIIGTGIENGVTYIDIRYSGTATATAAFTIFHVGNVGALAASPSQVWTNSLWARVVAGSTSGFFMAMQEFDSGSNFLRGPATQQALTSTLTRYAQTITVGTSTASIRAGCYLSVSNTEVVNVTLRIGLPQLEQGAFATSVIPTTAATVTRAADAASISGSNFSSWYRQDEGTVFHQGATTSGGTFFSIDDITTNNRITAYFGSATTPRFFVAASGVTSCDLTSSAINAAAVFAQINAYKLNDFAIATNGGTVSTDISGSVPTVSRIGIGANVASAANINGTIRRLTYWPQRLPNTTLQQITQ